MKSRNCATKLPIATRDSLNSSKKSSSPPRKRRREGPRDRAPARHQCDAQQPTPSLAETKQWIETWAATIAHASGERPIIATISYQAPTKLLRDRSAHIHVSDSRDGERLAAASRRAAVLCGAKQS